MTRRALACLLLLAAGCNPARDDADGAAADTTSRRDSAAAGATTSAAPSAAVITPEGWGPLRIGMTRAEVVAAAGPDANPNAVGGADPASCDQFRPRSAPQGLLVMIERDTLTRISVSRTRDVKSDAGFAVGDSAAAIERHFGARAVTSPHKYVGAPARYVTVWTSGRPPSPAARGIVYEIGGDGLVTHMHAGGPSIQYVEGCS